MLGVIAKLAQAAARIVTNPATRQAIALAARKAAESAGQLTAKTVQACKAWPDNRAIRQVYNSGARALGKQLKHMEQQGKSLRDRAEVAYHSREAAMKKAREMMPNKEQVKELLKRDAAAYKGKRPDTFDNMITHTKDKLRQRTGVDPSEEQVLQEIVESATRTDWKTNLKHLTW